MNTYISIALSFVSFGIALTSAIIAWRSRRTVQRMSEVVDDLSNRYGEAMSVVSMVARVPHAAQPEIAKLCEDLLTKHGVTVEVKMFHDDPGTVVH